MTEPGIGLVDFATLADGVDPLIVFGEPEGDVNGTMQEGHKLERGADDEHTLRRAREEGEEVGLGEVCRLAGREVWKPSDRGHGLWASELAGAGMRRSRTALVVHRRMGHDMDERLKDVGVVLPRTLNPLLLCRLGAASCADEVRKGIRRRMCVHRRRGGGRC